MWRWRSRWKSEQVEVQFDVEEQVEEKVEVEVEEQVDVEEEEEAHLGLPLATPSLARVCRSRASPSGGEVSSYFIFKYSQLSVKS